jgi:hypothetical protein
VRILLPVAVLFLLGLFIGIGYSFFKTKTVRAQYEIDVTQVKAVFDAANIASKEIKVTRSSSPSEGSSFTRPGEVTPLYSVLLKEESPVTFSLVFFINDDLNLTTMSEEDFLSLNQALIQSIQLEIVSKLFYRYPELDSRFCENKPCGESGGNVILRVIK